VGSGDDYSLDALRWYPEEDSLKVVIDSWA